MKGQPTQNVQLKKRKKEENNQQKGEIEGKGIK